MKAVFSSDIGHWDVPDMREVVEEAYEMVEHEMMSEDRLRGLRVHQCRAPVCGHEPGLLQGDGGGVGGGEGVGWVGRLIDQIRETIKKMLFGY